jgi:hypothetical protein
VRISPSLDPRTQLLCQHLGDYIQGPGDEIRFNSPFKSDLKHHLYINLRKDKFVDYKSGECGSLSYLYYLIGCTGDSRPIPVSSTEQLRERLHELSNFKAFVLPIATLPDSYHPVSQGSLVHKYLLSRGITDDDILTYRIGEGVIEDDVKVIIPSYGKDGECEYWVSRTIDPANYCRYKNPQVSKKYHVGFLYTAIKHSPESVILTEGVFSAIVAGRNAVATYGKFVSNDQILKIKRLGVKEVIVSLDGDALDESIDVCKRCLKHNLKVSLVILPKDKDPADLGREMYKIFLASAVPIDALSLMRLRLCRI